MLYTILVIFVVGLTSRLLFVPIFLGMICLKRYIHKMNEEKWSRYFADMSEADYLKRLAMLLLLPISICNILGYVFLRKKHDRNVALKISVVTFFVDILQISFKLYNKREKLLKLIRDIKMNETIEG